MRRRHAGLVAGYVLGGLLAWWTSGLLGSAPGWKALEDAAPGTASYLRWAVVLPLPPVAGLLGSALVTFLEVHRIIAPARPKTRPLPPMPFDSKTTQLIIGEEHNQDGSRSETPRWLVLPEKGMYTGILVTGATGAAKTSAAQYPFTAQLIRLSADDPAERMAA